MKTSRLRGLLEIAALMAILFLICAPVQAQWAKVHGRLAGAQPAYVKAGNVIRLQAVGYADKARAQRACNASGVSCVVIAP